MVDFALQATLTDWLKDWNNGQGVLRAGGGQKICLRKHPHESQLHRQIWSESQWEIWGGKKGGGWGGPLQKRPFPGGQGCPWRPPQWPARSHPAASRRWLFPSAGMPLPGKGPSAADCCPQNPSPPTCPWCLQMGPSLLHQQYPSVHKERPRVHGVVLLCCFESWTKVKVWTEGPHPWCKG